MAKWKEPPEVKLGNLKGIKEHLMPNGIPGPELSAERLENEKRWSLGAEVKSAAMDPYAPLRRVLDLALEQAAYGKGVDRHANGQPFDRQPMMEISRMIGGPAGCFYQAMKKTQEASRMDPEAAKREILGAINYLAGAYLLIDEV